MFLPSGTKFSNCRYILVLLGFIGFIFNYALRVNINVIIKRMTKESCTSLTLNSTKQDEDLFCWDSKTQIDVVSTFFYGYVVLQIPGGRMAEVIGGKRVIGLSMALTALLTLLIPVAAKVGGTGPDDYPYLLVVIRVLMGVCEGATFPGITSMMARWAPSSERSLMTTLIMAGSQVGTIVGFFISGILVDNLGWEATFYIQGSSTFVWLALWMLLVFDTPDSNPFITEEEVELIKSGLPATKAVSPPVPWMSILKSMPFWAILVANFSNNWGFHLLMTELPQYLDEVFPEYMKDATVLGLWTAIPYTCMWVSSLVFASVCDLMIRKNWLGVSNSRKFYTVLSQTGPAICLLILLLSVTNENPQLTLTLALFTAAVTLQGGLYSGWITNSQDIAPNFAGTILGITNACGAIPGFVANQIAGVFINDNPSDVFLWRPVWIITCIILVCSSIFFSIFAQGSPQPWNNVEESSKTLVTEEQTKDYATIENTEAGRNNRQEKID